MKKTIYIIAAITLVSACKKSVDKRLPHEEQISIYYLRIQEVDNDNNTTVSPIVIIKNTNL